MATLALCVSCGYAIAVPPVGLDAASVQPANRSHTDESRPSSRVRERIRIAALPYKTSDQSATVVLAVEVDPSIFRPATAAGWSGRFEVTWTATDERGRRRTGDAYDDVLAVATSARDTASRHGARIVSEFDLPPGRYQLRVSVRGARSANAASTLEVPEFNAQLTLGGVALSSISAGEAVTLASARTRLALPAPPTARRDFETGETLVLFTEVYESRDRLEDSPVRGTAADPGARGDHTTHVVFELRAPDGSILRTVPARRSNGDGRRPGTHTFSERLSLADVPPGPYVIRVTARANIGNADTTTRDVQIRVRPRGWADEVPSRSTSRA